MAKKRWSDLSDGEKAGAVVLATAQVALATAAWVDLARRPRDLVRGPKPAWAFGILVNWIGPIAYFTVGRRRAPAIGATPEP